MSKLSNDPSVLTQKIIFLEKLLADPRNRRKRVSIQQKINWRRKRLAEITAYTQETKSIADSAREYVFGKPACKTPEIKPRLLSPAETERAIEQWNLPAVKKMLGSIDCIHGILTIRQGMVNLIKCHFVADESVTLEQLMEIEMNINKQTEYRTWIEVTHTPDK